MVNNMAWSFVSYVVHLTAVDDWSGIAISVIMYDYLS